MNEMSVWAWQERFPTGDSSSRDRAVQFEAGWYDWFCRDDALAGCLIKAPSVVLAVTDPFLLDNNSLDGSLYDDVRFEPLAGDCDGKYFLLPWTGPTMWAAHTAQEGAGAITRRSHSRPALSPKVKTEILEVLFANMEISGDEIAAILKKHHVNCDIDVLQDRYRRQLGQRLMASLRDASGEREVLSNGKGRYVVLECCRDRQQLAAIRRRIQNQAHGLNASAGKVRSRIAVLDRLIARLRKAA